MSVRKSESVGINGQEDIGLVRQMVRQWAVELGFSLVEQTKLVTATSELARNTVVHGGGGMVEPV
jgi:serine/threonine-protein kinase RsbT